MTNESALWTPARHPLARFLRDVAAGTNPPADGEWIRVTPWVPHIQGIIAFPAHAVLAVSYDHTDVELQELGVEGGPGAHGPRIVATLAKTGWIGPLEVMFVGAGTGEQSGGGHLVARNDLAHHPIVEHARRVRTEVQIFGSADPAVQDVVVLARGIGGLREISVRVDPATPGRDADLVAAALACVPEDEVVVACVPPADIPAVMTLREAGMRPVGTVQLFTDRPERRS